MRMKVGGECEDRCYGNSSKGKIGIPVVPAPALHPVPLGFLPHSPKAAPALWGRGSQIGFHLGQGTPQGGA